MTGWERGLLGMTDGGEGDPPVAPTHNDMRGRSSIKGGELP